MSLFTEDRCYLTYGYTCPVTSREKMIEDIGAVHKTVSICMRGSQILDCLKESGIEIKNIVKPI